jgi:hypothetical protein
LQRRGGPHPRYRLRRPDGDKWQRFTLTAKPGSLYMMRGESRQIWQHSIPAVEAAPILDHLPDDQMEDAGLGSFAGRIIVGPASGWPM